MIFRMYDKTLDLDIDEWGSSSYSTNSYVVNKYALFSEKPSEIYDWYISHVGEMSDIFDKIIVVTDGSIKIAFIVFNYFHDEDGKRVCGINPILVNPKYINQGFGKRIIKEIIERKCEMFDMKPDYIYAGIDNDNLICKRMFEKNGFVSYGKSNDEEFIYYKYIIK